MIKNSWLRATSWLMNHLERRLVFTILTPHHTCLLGIWLRQHNFDCAVFSNSVFPIFASSFNSLSSLLISPLHYSNEIKLGEKGSTCLCPWQHACDGVTTSAYLRPFVRHSVGPFWPSVIYSVNQCVSYVCPSYNENDGNKDILIKCYIAVRTTDVSSLSESASYSQNFTIFVF